MIRRFLHLFLFFPLLAEGCIKVDPPPNPFRSPVTYRVGKSPSFVAAADLNQDDLLDLVVANTESQSLSILFGNNDGSFQEPGIRLTTGKQPRWVGLGDFNEDQRTDLVVLNNEEDNLYLLLNLGEGNFIRTLSYEVGRSPYSATVHDFNGDHHLDLAVVSRFDRLLVLLGNGEGQFEEAMVADPGATPTGIISGFFNNDLFVDLAIANNGIQSNDFIFFWGKGDGTFQKGESYRTGMSPLTLLSEDFNRDGRADILVINGLRDSLSLFLQNQDGRFGKPLDFGAEGGPVSSVAADFNRDGILDLVVANSRSENISFLVGKEDGSFHHPPLNLSTSISLEGATVAPFHIAAGDFNQDGKTDLAVANNDDQSISIFLAKHRGGS